MTKDIISSFTRYFSLLFVLLVFGYLSYTLPQIADIYLIDIQTIGFSLLDQLTFSFLAIFCIGVFHYICVQHIVQTHIEFNSVRYTYSKINWYIETNLPLIFSNISLLVVYMGTINAVSLIETRSELSNIVHFDAEKTPGGIIYEANFIIDNIYYFLYGLFGILLAVIIIITKEKIYNNQRLAHKRISLYILYLLIMFQTISLVYLIWFQVNEFIDDEDVLPGMKLLAIQKFHELSILISLAVIVSLIIIYIYREVSRIFGNKKIFLFSLISYYIFISGFFLYPLYLQWDNIINIVSDEYYETPSLLTVMSLPMFVTLSIVFFNWILSKLQITKFPTKKIIIMFLFNVLLLFFIVDPIDSTYIIHGKYLFLVVFMFVFSLLTILRGYDIKYRFPFTIIIVVSLMFSEVYINERNGIRLLENDNKPNLVTFEESVWQWKKANDCERIYNEYDDTSMQRCPDAIVIAASGGASRAAYYTSLFLGAILDESNIKDLDVDRKIFAMSGVSGGSLGISLAYSAIADSTIDTQSGSRTLISPCTTPDVNIDWRDCLSNISSEDYLSSTIASGIFVDLFPFGLYDNRSSTLERKWEKSYRDYTGNNTLERGISDIRKDIVNKREWVPLLVLNSSSSSNGKRVVSTDFDWFTYNKDRTRKSKTKIQQEMLDEDGIVSTAYGDYCYQIFTEYRIHLCKPVFIDTYNVLELVHNWARAKDRFDAYYNNTLKRKRLRCDYCDIRISTGASLSARFPIISTPGKVYNGNYELIDNIVDGGYFENFGATSALEIARGLNRFGISVKLVLITNEPQMKEFTCITGDEIEFSYPKNTIGPQNVLSVFGSLNAARSARGTYIIEKLCDEIRNKKEKAIKFYHIRVAKDGGLELSGNRNIAMSWALSPFTKRSLDADMRRLMRSGTIREIIE